MDALQKLALARMARVDPPPFDVRTGEPYGVIRVAVTSHTDGQVIPGGHRAMSGEGVFEIYESQLGDLEALVDPASASDLDRVRADYEHHVSECESGRNERPYLPSIPASYRRLFHRDMLPFSMVEVLPAPKRAKRAAAGN